MKLATRLLFALPWVAACLLFVPSVHANSINGIAYCGISSADANNTPAPGASFSGTECATFAASTIDFNSNGINTLGSFLTSNGSVLGSIEYLNGYTADSNLDFTFFQFVGTAYFVQGQMYSATHDDGTVMAVNSTTVINSPGITAPVTNTFLFTGITGDYDFTYDYTENQGGSEYVSDAADVTPEPQSLVLCGTGALFIFFAIRRQIASTGPKQAQLG